MIVIDVGTTGLDPYKCSIVSVGAVDFNNRRNYFYKECKIFDGAETSIDNKALEINGFTLEQITDPHKISLKEILKDFLGWIANIDNITLAGKNISFDRDFIKASLERYSLPYGFRHRSVDIHSVAYAHRLRQSIEVPIKNNITDINLDKTLEYIGLPKREGIHNALEDARVEAEALCRLIYGKNVFEEFKKYEIPRHVAFYYRNL